MQTADGEQQQFADCTLHNILECCNFLERHEIVVNKI